MALINICEDQEVPPEQEERTANGANKYLIGPRCAIRGTRKGGEGNTKTKETEEEGEGRKEGKIGEKHKDERKKGGRRRKER